MSSGPTTIGIVVPNYNGVRYIGECIKSIVSQGIMPRCLVVDGASDDDSLRRIVKYQKQIEVISEADHGQADAIRKGFERLDTDLVGWLNSDDLLMPDALNFVIMAAEARPEAVIYQGDVQFIDAHGDPLYPSKAIPIDYSKMRSAKGKTLQPGSFYRRNLLMQAGNVDPDYHLLMDVDLWIRLLRLGPACRIEATLAKFRVHDAAKSSQPPWRYYGETLKIARRHQADVPFRGFVGRACQIGQHLIRYGIKQTGVKR